MRRLVRHMLRHGPGAVIKRRSPKGARRPFVAFRILDMFDRRWNGHKSKRRRVLVLHPTKGWRFP